MIRNEGKKFPSFFTSWAKPMKYLEDAQFAERKIVASQQANYMNRNNRKYIMGVCASFLLALCLAACGKEAEEPVRELPALPGMEDTEAVSEPESELPSEEYSYFNPDGETLESRILVPQGFERLPEEEGSFAAFVRNYPLKEAGSPVLLYDGREKGNQSAHVGVFALPIENRDLQQCADSVMRFYGEYYLQSGQYDKIEFHFTNGFLAEYDKWVEGYRIAVDGNNVSWVKSAEYDDSYDNFVDFMRMVFTYAGTLSMDSEAEAISPEEIAVGDIFIKGGSPGHVVMVADVCVDEKGNKAFLLAQGYMPAQEFHILKNPLHEENPWYYLSELSYPLVTPEYVFEEGSCKRLYP